MARRRRRPHMGNVMIPGNNAFDQAFDDPWSATQEVAGGLLGLGANLGLAFAQKELEEELGLERGAAAPKPKVIVKKVPVKSGISTPMLIGGLVLAAGAAWFFFGRK